MPSTSPKQARFMAAAANNPKFAKKAGIPQNTAKDFHSADKAKGNPFGKGKAKKKLKKGGHNKLEMKLR